MRSGYRDLREDLILAKAGILDVPSLINGYRAKANPVQFVARRAHRDGSPCHSTDDPRHGPMCLGWPTCNLCPCGGPGELKAIRRTHNLRTNQGGDWQAYQMGGRPAIRYTGTATATSATSVTDSGGTFSTVANITGGTGGLVGCIVIMGNVFGIVVSNTGTVITVERWINCAATADVTGATPGNVTYVVVEGAAPGYWLALTNDSGTPSSVDTNLASEITTNGFARAIGLFAHTLLSATSASTVASIYTLVKTWTSTGGNTSAQKCGIFLSSTVANNLMQFENTFTAISGLITNDTLQLTYTVTA